MNINPLLLTDGYKLSHHQQYPKGTEYIYSNFTARSNKYMPSVSHVISFGQQYVIKEIDRIFSHFFEKTFIHHEISSQIKRYLGKNYNIEHFVALYKLGYLPIRVKAIEEGEKVPFKIPLLTIINTHSDFFWLPNFLETLISNLLWKPMTTATIAYEYRKLLTKWALKTDKKNIEFVKFQAHDFSMRGLDSIGAAISSGLGHITSFLGSDTLPVLDAAETYYYERDNICYSVPATEHSVMSAGKNESEFETFERLLDIYPTGILSIVSDTWDLWKVITEYLPKLKYKIMARDGKIVIRPDSGNPTDIICGKDWDFCKPILYKNNSGEDRPITARQIKVKEDEPRKYGVIELLWNIFGGTTNEQGYKVLDSHIGCIYGDSITLEKADEICDRLARKGFSSTNIIMGIGSYTYQYNTRDTFGFAMKATWAKINGKPINLSKNPITDDGTKKSATGLLHVGKYEDRHPKDNISLEPYFLNENCNEIQEKSGELKLIYENGTFYNQVTLEKIRSKIDEHILRENL